MILKIEDFTLGFGLGTGILFVFFLLGLLLYFIPTIAAYFNNHKQIIAIFMLNLFGGWTVFGWVGAIVWAFVKGENQARLGERYKKETEFNSIKRGNFSVRNPKKRKREHQKSTKNSATNSSPSQITANQTKKIKAIPRTNIEPSKSLIKTRTTLLLKELDNDQKATIQQDIDNVFSTEMVYDLLEQLKIPEKNVQAIAKLKQHNTATIPVLKKILKEEKAKDLEYVVWVLGEIGYESEEAKMVLLEALYSSNKKVLHYATQAIKKVPLKKEAVPPLIKMLEDSDESIRRDATEALGEIGVSAKESIPALIKLLTDSNFQVRLGSMWALGNIGREAKIAFPSLLLVLKQGSEKEKLWASAALSMLKQEDISEAKPYLQHFIRSRVEKLKDNSWNIRKLAAMALGNLGPLSKETIPNLKPLLRDKHYLVRNATEKALTKIEMTPTNDISILFERLYNPNIAISENACEALKSQAITSIETLAQIILNLQSPETLLRDYCEKILAQISPLPKVIPKFISALKHEEKLVKEFAIVALRNFGANAKEAVPELIVALKDKSISVRKETIETLGEIGIDAQEAVPELIKLKNTEIFFKDFAEKALLQIEAKEKF